MDPALLGLALTLLPALLLLVPTQAMRLRAAAAGAGRPLGLGRAWAVALASVLAGLLTAACVGGLVIATPALLRAPVLPLLWFTALPALLLGLWALSATARFTARCLLR